MCVKITRVCYSLPTARLKVFFLVNKAFHRRFLSATDMGSLHHFCLTWLRWCSYMDRYIHIFSCEVLFTSSYSYYLIGILTIVPKLRSSFSFSFLKIVILSPSTFGCFFFYFICRPRKLFNLELEWRQLFAKFGYILGRTPMQVH